MPDTETTSLLEPECKPKRKRKSKDPLATLTRREKKEIFNILEQVASGRQKFEIVHVTWEDARAIGGVRDSWMDAETTLFDAKSPALIETVGLKLFDCKKYILVCQSASRGAVDITLKIPRGNVRKLRKLGETVA